MTSTGSSISSLGARFEEIQMLGQGACGTVYKVLDRQRNEIVALKVLADRVNFQENSEERFMDEIRASLNIKHPNVVRAYDAVRIGESLAFTMEFIEGCHLLDCIDTRTFLPEEIENIMSQLLEGLSALHERKIVHRDIKLENVLLQPDGTIKLSDLGLLKNLETAGLTKPGLILGTPIYMAPEYVQTGKYDERADLYSCGIILYELLSGKRRNVETDGTAVLVHLIKTNFQVPKLKVTSEYQRFIPILNKALSVNPAARYQSAKEMQFCLLNEHKTGTSRFSFKNIFKTLSPK